MKRILTLAAALCTLASCCAQPQTLTLSDGWTISHESSELTYPASVPSTIMGILGDESLYSDGVWTYSTTFKAPSGSCTYLDLEGVNHRSEVYLNGEFVGITEGPYRQYSFDITKLVKRNNKLELKLYTANPGDFNIGFVDWNPRPADQSTGIFRPVKVVTTGAARIASSAVRTISIAPDASSAQVLVETYASNPGSKAVKGELSVSIEGAVTTIPVELAAGQTKVLQELVEISNPRLWWPYELGTPELYTAQFDLKIGSKKSSEESVTFGVREVSSYFTDEGHRGFIVNGKKIMMRGAGWTDDIYLRNPAERNAVELAYVKDMNLNTVRLENFWGTSQDLYNKCDEMGIMLIAGWSCFWEWEVYTGKPADRFGCIETEDEMNLIAASLEDQILWLRNHPSVIAWYVGSDMLPRPALEKRYHEIMARVDDRPLVCSAKGLVSRISGPTGMKMVGPYDYVAPSYWTDPVADGGAFGFNTETGIGAQIPFRESMEKMVGTENLWPVGEAWDKHCTVAGEAMHSLDVLKECVEQRYGAATDVDDFIKKAQLVDYDGTRAMFDGFRINCTRGTGIIQWMLNSAWPSLYWQLYDWYLQPVASYYSVKHACAPQQIVYNYTTRKAVAVNNENAPAEFKARLELINAAGKTVRVEEIPVSLAAPESKEIGSEVKGFDGFYRLSIVLADGTPVSENVYAIASKEDVHDWKKSDWIRTPLKQHADYKWLSTLGESPLDVKVEPCAGGAKVALTNDSDAPAFFVRMAAYDAAGELVTPAIWEDNLVFLAPGETRIYDLCAEGVAKVAVSGWNTPKTAIEL